MFLVLVGLVHQLVVHFDALRRRVAHTFYFSVIVLHFYFFQTLVRDLPDHVRILLIVLSSDYLRWRLR